MTDHSDVKYIAIEGVIGAGKTSLAKKISDRLRAELILEQFEVNPFLEKFYSDRKRFAFQTQMFFLINRFKQQEELNGYRWIDPKAKVVGIPIDRAMELVVAESSGSAPGSP